MKPIVILTSRAPITYLLVNELLKSFDVALVVFENFPFNYQWRLLNRRHKRLGTWRVVQQTIFMVWDRLIMQRTSTPLIAELLRNYDINAPDERVATLDTTDINSPEVIETIRRISPLCGVVSGTSILRSQAVDSIPIWLNIHCGITPRYRGVHGAFWAVYEGRPDLAGVTIHQIDAGIDTGGIVSQAKIDLVCSDTYRTLPIKQYIKGTPLMISAMKQAICGNLSTYARTDLESKLWYTPTLAEYRKFQSQLKKYTEG